MTVVYIDALFLLNFVVDYLLLLCAGRLAGEVLHRGRLALGAALAGAYAAAVFLPGMGFLLHPLCKLAAAVLALLISYGGSRRLLRVTLVFFAVSAARQAQRLMRSGSLMEVMPVAAKNLPSESMQFTEPGTTEAIAGVPPA